MNNILYVPILKWKQGEQGALLELSNNIKKYVLPLIEVPTQVYDFKNEKYKKTLEEHIEKIPKTISKSWNNEFYFDISNLNTEFLSNGTNINDYFNNNFDKTTLSNCIPVYTPTLKQNIDYFKKCIINDKSIAIRLKFNKIKNLSEYIDGIISNLNINSNQISNIDLIVDLEYINTNDEDRVLKLLDFELKNIKNLNYWRLVTIVGTSFPEKLTEVETKSYCTIPRSFYKLYNNYVSNYNVSRKFLFGDYCISNPKTADDIDPRFLSPACNIRYTMKTNFFVIKGTSFRKHGGSQFAEMCNIIVSKPNVFFGRNFSNGDAYIEDCAKRLVNTGNLSTWRRIGTIHHITLLVKQLSNSLDI